MRRCLHACYYTTSQESAFNFLLLQSWSPDIKLMTVISKLGFLWPRHARHENFKGMITTLMELLKQNIYRKWFSGDNLLKYIYLIQYTAIHKPHDRCLKPSHFRLHVIMCGSRNYPYLPQGWFSLWTPPPLLKFQFSFIFSFKNFGLWDPPPPRNFQWPSMGRVWIFSGTTQLLWQ